MSMNKCGNETNIYGIDMGSQRCVMACKNGEIVLNELGMMTTSTLLAFKSNERFLGESAVLSSSSNPSNTVDHINVLLGMDFEQVQKTLAKFPRQRAEFIEENGQPKAVVNYLQQEKQTFSVPQLCAMLLGKLSKYAKAGVTEGKNKFVIAIPDGWGENEKKALLEASLIAKMDVISMVTRMEALSRCFHCKHPMKSEEESDKVPGQELPSKFIVVLDMGHTSTSTAVVKLTSDNEKIVSSRFDPQLGSRNFDYHLFYHFQNELSQRSQPLNICANSKKGMRLLYACEKIKKLLSTVAECETQVENLMDERDIPIKICRDVFQQLCSAEKEKILQMLTEVLKEADLNPNQISSVEIVGGGTRIPLVQHCIMQIFGEHKIGRMMDSTTAVAIGAAFYGSSDMSIIDEAEKEKKCELLTAEIEFEQVMKEKDEELNKLASARNELESYIYDMRSKVTSGLPNTKLIKKSEVDVILDDIEGWLYTEEAENATLELIMTKTKDLKESIGECCKEYFAAIEEENKQLEASLEEESKKAAAELEANGGNEDHDFRKLKTPDRMRLVQKNKDEGSDLLRGGNYEHAAARYVKALTHASKFFDLNPEDKVEVTKLKLSLYLNLAQCFLKLENYTKVRHNCKDALDLDPKCVKAYYRRAFALEKLRKFDEAEKDIKEAVLLSPEDRAIAKLHERIKLQQKKELQKEKKMWGKAFA